MRGPPLTPFAAAADAALMEQGVLRGMDQSTNLILEDCEERVFAPNEAPEQTKSGLNLVRGDNMCVALPRRPHPSLRPA